MIKLTSPTIGTINAMRRDIGRKLQQVGVLGTLQHGAMKLIRALKGGFSVAKFSEVDSFDSIHGTDTARIVSVGALDIAAEKLPHSNRYQAVAPEEIYEIIEEVGVDHQDYTFVDIGSGKGRALLLASHFPFKKILGVEISAALTAVAEANIRIYKDKRQRCRSIQVICQDGGSYELPREQAILYLNNPFDAAVMGRLVAHTERSIQESPRDLYVVYQWAHHRSIWDASPMFRLVKSTPVYCIYKIKSPA